MYTDPDTHPTHEPCECGAVICVECGDTPYECLVGPGFHCAVCVTDCEGCMAIIEPYAAGFRGLTVLPGGAA